MHLSDQILDRCAPVLDRMLTHRFVEDICAGALPPDVFDRYLAYEGAFVDTAITIFARAVIRAPDIASRRHLIGVLDALANVQISYFEAQFARRGINWETKLPPAVAAFRDEMDRLAAEGDFLTIVTAMFAAEWMYWCWCKRAMRSELGAPPLRDWIALHTNDTFAAQALWLKDALDRHGLPADLERLSAIFAHVTELEIAFHHAPYEVSE